MLVEFHTKLKLVQTIEVFKITYRTENLVLEDSEWYNNVTLDCLGLFEDDIIQVVSISNLDKVITCIVAYDKDLGDLVFVDAVASLMGSSIVTIDRDDIFLFRKQCKIL